MVNRNTWVTVLLLALAAPAYAQLYKWVDADGKVHYSDQPPPATARKEQKLNIRTTPPESAAPSAEGEVPAAKPAAGPTTAEREMEYRKRKVEEEQKQQKAEAEQKHMQENCLNAQRRARNYQEDGRIFTVDEKGERVYMDDEARMRNLRDAQLEIAKYCK